MLAVQVIQVLFSALFIALMGAITYLLYRTSGTMSRQTAQAQQELINLAARSAETVQQMLDTNKHYADVIEQMVSDFAPLRKAASSVVAGQVAERLEMHVPPDSRLEINVVAPTTVQASTPPEKGVAASDE